MVETSLRQSLIIMLNLWTISRCQVSNEEDQQKYYCDVFVYVVEYRLVGDCYFVLQGALVHFVSKE
jgi:hypothetical protein